VLIAKHRDTLFLPLSVLELKDPKDPVTVYIAYVVYYGCIKYFIRYINLRVATGIKQNFISAYRPNKLSIPLFQKLVLK
jgi:hypothetical protein